MEPKTGQEKRILLFLLVSFVVMYGYSKWILPRYQGTARNSARVQSLVLPETPSEPIAAARLTGNVRVGARAVNAQAVSRQDLFLEDDYLYIYVKNSGGRIETETVDSRQ